MEWQCLVSFEGDGENWLPESDNILEYSEQNITSIGQENSGNKMSVYPNPASSQLTFFLEGLAENNTPISLESLNDGVYFYRLKSKGNNFSGKLVMKK